MCANIKGLKDYYQVDSINPNFVYSVVNLIRKYISHYLKEIYINPMTDKNKNSLLLLTNLFFVIIGQLRKNLGHWTN